MHLKHIIIQKDPQVYSAFPDILRLRNGDLVVVFREADVRPTVTHVDPSSRIVLMRSKDEGRTWPIQSKVVIDASDGNYDINCAAITELEDQLLVNNHRWRLLPLSAEEEIAAWEGKRRVLRAGKWHFVAVMDGVYLHRSPDRGQTWGKPEKVAFPPYEYYIHTGMNGAVRISDGSLLLPLHGRCVGEQPVCSPGADRGSALTTGAADQGSDAVILVRSRDGGRSWGEPSLAIHDPEGKIGLDEPALTRLRSGKMLAMLRTDGADGYLYQAHSKDDGKTWEGLRNSGIWGHPAHLLELQSGTVLCTYGHRREPFGIRARLSEDEGETWGKEIVIRDDGLHRDLGYPASVQLEDGQILSVYYFHDAGGTRFIGGTFWREEQLA